MGSVSPKMEGVPVGEVPLEDEDEDDMTSVMSSDQRKALQKAAKTEKESATLERDTARPPPAPEEAAVSIPRAAPIPAEARAAEAPRAETTAAKSEPVKTEPAKQAPAAAPQASTRSADAKSGWATWELVAFLLLAASIAVALRFT
jgi:hypothetical protein